jgi:RF-1 domain
VTAPPHPAAIPPDELLTQCDQTFTRRSGPGGQNRNKVETAVILLHRRTGLTAEASERRTQGDNRAAALFRLRIRLALSIRLPIDPNGPSSLWQSRRRSSRISISPSHDDFPALLAEAIDALKSTDHDVKRASEVLGVTPSQLIKFLKLEPRALAQLNETRASRGERRLI